MKQSRFDERKDVSSAMKLLPKLFPAEIVIHTPKDKLQQNEWNKQLATDRAIIKKNANAALLDKVLAKANAALSKPFLPPSFSKNRAFRFLFPGLRCLTPSPSSHTLVMEESDVECVVGWAISDHFMHSDVKIPPSEADDDSTLSNPQVVVPVGEEPNPSLPSQVGDLPVSDMARPVAISPANLQFALKLLEESRPPKMVCYLLFCCLYLFHTSKFLRSLFPEVTVGCRD